MNVRGYSPSQGRCPAGERHVRFGKGIVNIIATSDNHGKFEPIPKLFSNIANHVDEIFPEMNKKSTLNIGIFGGDWFMDPGRAGYLTDKTKKAGDYQLEFLNKLVSSVKNLVPSFKAYYTPGNHCFDGGDKMLVNYLRKADVTTVLSNSSPNQSPVMKMLNDAEKKHIRQSVVLEVPDDKKPDLVHKVLMLGVTIPGVDFYNPGIMNDIHFLDRSSKKDSKILEEDLKSTYEVLNVVIRRFKKENPNGAVVLTSHTGNRISEMFAKKVNNIDLIFNGHDHEDKDYIVKKLLGQKTRIISLGDDSKKLDSIQIKFNDKGKYENFSDPVKKYYSDDAVPIKNNPFLKMITSFFKKDKKPYVFISGPNCVHQLNQSGIRTKNNLLANTVTDSILNGIREIEPQTSIFGVASSAFRQDLPVNDSTSNLLFRNVLIGQTDSLSKVYTGKLKGNDIIKTVVENIEDHMKDMERNTIVQWSGLQVNKKELMSAIEAGDTKNLSKLKEMIKVKNAQGQYESINPDKAYGIAVPNYFFMRPKIPVLKELENHFKPLRDKLPEHFTENLVNESETVNNPFSDLDPILSMDDLLRRDIAKNNNRLEVADLKEVRIIT